MYAKFTINLVETILACICKNVGIDRKNVNAKEIFKKVCKEDIGAFYFCGTVCKSGKECIKEVASEGMHCYMHDPDRKCQGTTVHGKPCGRIAKIDEDFCCQHRDAGEMHHDNSRNKGKGKDETPPDPTKIREAEAMRAKELSINTRIFLDNMAKKSKERAQKERAKNGTLDEESSDEEEEDIFPLSSKVVDITSKKDVPLAKKAKWVTYLPNPALEYATRFTVNGKYIIRLQEKNVYVELCPDEMMGKDCNVPAMSKKEARILKKMKLREATKAEMQKYLDGTSQDEHEEGSDDEESVEEAKQITSKGSKSKKKTIRTCNGTTKEGAQCTKPIANGEYCRFHNKQSSSHVNKEDVKWKKFPSNKKLEYTLDICINGKYPLKRRREDVVVGLLTKHQLNGDMEDNGKYEIRSKEKEKLFTMGFVPQDESPDDILEDTYYLDSKPLDMALEYIPLGESQVLKKKGPEIVESSAEPLNNREKFNDCAFLLKRLAIDKPVDSLPEEHGLDDNYQHTYDDDHAFLLKGFTKDEPVDSLPVEDELDDNYQHTYDDDHAFLLKGLAIDKSVDGLSEEHELDDNYQHTYDDDHAFLLKGFTKDESLNNIPKEDTDVQKQIPHVTVETEDEGNVPLISRSVTVETEDEGDVPLIRRSVTFKTEKE
jgi:hypothetical protein